MSVSDVARQFRERRGWSQERVAEAAGISDRTVRRLESGGTFGPDALAAVGRVLGVDLAQYAAFEKADPNGARLRHRLLFLDRLNCQLAEELAHATDGLVAPNDEDGGLISVRRIGSSWLADGEVYDAGVPVFRGAGTGPFPSDAIKAAVISLVESLETWLPAGADIGPEVSEAGIRQMVTAARAHGRRLYDALEDLDRSSIVGAQPARDRHDRCLRLVIGMHAGNPHPVSVSACVWVAGELICERMGRGSTVAEGLLDALGQLALCMTFWESQHAHRSAVHDAWLDGQRPLRHQALGTLAPGEEQARLT